MTKIFEQINIDISKRGQLVFISRQQRKKTGVAMGSPLFPIQPEFSISSYELCTAVIKIKRVHKFNYMGSVVTNDNNTKTYRNRERCFSEPNKNIK